MARTWRLLSSSFELIATELTRDCTNTDRMKPELTAGPLCLRTKLGPGRGLDYMNQWSLVCATSLGRNTRPLTQRTRDRENGNYGRESSMAVFFCHKPVEWFLSTTLVLAGKPRRRTCP